MLFERCPNLRLAVDRAELEPLPIITRYRELPVHLVSPEVDPQHTGPITLASGNDDSLTVVRPWVDLDRFRITAEPLHPFVEVYARLLIGRPTPWPVHLVSATLLTPARDPRFGYSAITMRSHTMTPQKQDVESLERAAESLRTVESFARDLLSGLLFDAAATNSNDGVTVIPATITISARPKTDGVSVARCVNVKLCWESESLQQSICRDVSICR